MNDLLNLCRTCGSSINTEVDIKLSDKSNYSLVTLIEDITDMWVRFFIMVDSYYLMPFFTETQIF